MHELSIALSIVEGASQEARNRGAAKVEVVHLKLGALSGVVKDALLFSYSLACDDTLLSGSQLVIEDIPVVVYCHNCEAEKVLHDIQRFCCPTCGSVTPDVVRGRELELFAIEICEESDDIAREFSGLAEVSQ